MERKIRKVANCIMISIPPATLEATGIKIGDKVDIIAKNGSIEINRIEKE